MRAVDVALPVPLSQTFTYRVPDKFAQAAQFGARVVAPFGSRKLVGVIVAAYDKLDDTAGGAELKPIFSMIDDGDPAIGKDLGEFLMQLAAYYFAPIGEVMRLALPPIEKETAALLLEPSLFPEAARGLSPRSVQWVTALSASESDVKLTARDHAVLAHVRAAGAIPVAHLLSRWKSARAQVKKLAAAALVAIEHRPMPEAKLFASEAEREPMPLLTDAQEHATREISKRIESGEPATFLLHGVTGSGKTEVYLQAIAAVREQKRGAIVIVPEIALTPQLVARFRGRFGGDVAVIHSELSPRERRAMWDQLRSGKVDVAIGARSALFAPVRNLGLVVVDEEHDPSFKQEEGVRYHARDMAMLRAHRAGAVCVLGSATPSLESEYLSRQSKITKLELPDRARMQQMPSVEIIDLRRTDAGPTGDKRLSLPLHRAIESTLASGGQTILFLNRRGFAPSIRCIACGELAKCPSCSVAITFYRRRGGIVRCHYCDYQAPAPNRCAKCKAGGLVFEGLGTEKLEDTLQIAFPTARLARLDRDVVSGKNVEEVLSRVRRREVDILVGTQMVTKGHDLPDVTLVGVINADAALSIPDFRASERAFHLLVQVAGRAGRGDKPGHVMVQTYNPDHPAIGFAMKHDVTSFLRHELTDRAELNYPPFARLALVRIDAADESEAEQAAAHIAGRARTFAEKLELDVLGPSPAPIAKLRNRYRFRVLLRSADRASLRKVVALLEQERTKFPREVRCSIDIDPVQLL